MTEPAATSEKRIGAGRPSAPDREQRVIEIIETARAKRPRFKDSTVNMSHGAGGKATQTLIEGLYVPAFESDELSELGDSGVVQIQPAASSASRPGASGSVSLAMTTDTFVVKPLRFPGGSIGELAVCGTVNDLAAAGANAQALSLAFVLEEGLDAAVLREEVEAIARTAAEAGVSVVTGDTKVVERGHADGMYVCTTGIGEVDPRAALGTGTLQAGDRVLVSKTIGEHGTAIMLARGELGIEADVESDCRSLWPVADALLDSAGPNLRSMRDATRGGVASALNELARASAVGITVREASIPVIPEVEGASELLGIDPMYVANEGVMVAFVAPEAADAALAALRSTPGCDAAAEIAEVVAEPPGMVLVETAFGGRRVMDLLAGDPLPRIC
jgi:hydrogenase expression/formation protein HypE